MIEIRVDYTGELRCQALHEPSGTYFSTDAPVDNHGRGETFSPTDLVATALATCMATVLGIVAQRKEISLDGMRLLVRKYMASDPPRRIERLDVEFFMPLPEDHSESRLLQSTVLGCPVQNSIHPEIDVSVKWHWAGDDKGED